MIRILAVALILPCLVISASAQAQPAPGTAAPQAGAAAVKPAAKNAKAKDAAKPPSLADNGPCRIGIIPVVGDQFAVAKFNMVQIAVRVPIENWGLDDLVVARVRAAIGPGTGVRRIPYPKAAFAAYDHPAPALFRNRENELTTIVRQITANAGCERYLAVTKGTLILDGSQNFDVIARGVGVYNRGFGSLSYTRLFAEIQVTVFDGQTYAVRRTSESGPGFAEMLAGTGPLPKLDNAEFPEPATAAVGDSKLRDRSRALLTATLDKTLAAGSRETSPVPAELQLQKEATS